MKISRDRILKLVYGDEQPRFTQDSPILPDVWIEYGKNPNKAVELLITPQFGIKPGLICKELWNTKGTKLNI